jgi:hypothetical protein
MILPHDWQYGAASSCKYIGGPGLSFFFGRLEDCMTAGTLAESCLAVWSLEEWVNSAGAKILLTWNLLMYCH